jgi:hypothetical protein
MKIMIETAIEGYVSILINLADHGSLKLTQIEAATHIHKIKLKKCLSFLTEIRAAKVQTTNKIILYKITPYGTRILRFFKVEKST